MELLEHRVLVELLDRKVRLDLRERLFLDHLDQLVLQARQDLLETRVCEAQLICKQFIKLLKIVAVHMTVCLI